MRADVGVWIIMKSRSKVVVIADDESKRKKYSTAQSKRNQRKRVCFNNVLQKQFPRHSLGPFNSAQGTNELLFARYALEDSLETGNAPFDVKLLCACLSELAKVVDATTQASRYFELVEETESGASRSKGSFAVVPVPEEYAFYPVPENRVESLMVYLRVRLKEDDAAREHLVKFRLVNFRQIRYKLVNKENEEEVFREAAYTKPKIVLEAGPVNPDVASLITARLFALMQEEADKIYKAEQQARKARGEDEEEVVQPPKNNDGNIMEEDETTMHPRLPEEDVSVDGDNEGAGAGAAGASSSSSSSSSSEEEGKSGKIIEDEDEDEKGEEEDVSDTDLPSRTKKGGGGLFEGKKMSGKKGGKPLSLKELQKQGDDARKKAEKEEERRQKRARREAAKPQLPRISDAAKAEFMKLNDDDDDDDAEEEDDGKAKQKNKKKAPKKRAQPPKEPKPETKQQRMLRLGYEVDKPVGEAAKNWTIPSRVPRGEERRCYWHGEQFLFTAKIMDTYYLTAIGCRELLQGVADEYYRTVLNCAYDGGGAFGNLGREERERINRSSLRETFYVHMKEDALRSRARGVEDVDNTVFINYLDFVKRHDETLMRCMDDDRLKRRLHGCFLNFDCTIYHVHKNKALNVNIRFNRQELDRFCEEKAVRLGDSEREGETAKERQSRRSREFAMTIEELGERAKEAARYLEAVLQEFYGLKKHKLDENGNYVLDERGHFVMGEEYRYAHLVEQTETWRKIAEEEQHGTFRATNAAELPVMQGGVFEMSASEKAKEAEAASSSGGWQPPMHP